MSDSLSFKIGAGLSILSGILYLYARREYAQADAIKNAKYVQISELKQLVSKTPQKRLYVKFYGRVFVREPIKNEVGDNIAIHQRMVLGRVLNIRNPFQSVYPVFHSEDRAEWELVEDSTTPEGKKDGVCVSYAAIPELETMSEREEKIGNKWISGLFSFIGLKYPITYIHQTNVLRNNTKLFVVGEVYDVTHNPSYIKKDRNVPHHEDKSLKSQSSESTSLATSPSFTSSTTKDESTKCQLMLSPLVTNSRFSLNPKPFIMTRLTEQEVISQIERRARSCQTWSMVTGIGGIGLLIFSLFGTSDQPDSNNSS